MAQYYFNNEGVLVQVSSAQPLPAGVDLATAEQIAEWDAAETIRAAAGIPAPKSPEQAALEHAALLENIKNRGGLATPTEIANLNTTAEQAGQASVTPSASTRGTKRANTAPAIIEGRGAHAGDQYIQYEPLPGVAKVVTDESTVDSKTQTTRAAKDVEPARKDAAPLADAKPATPPSPNVPNADDDFDTPEKRAANSPTAKDKEK
jgi:hypothetical protein